MYKVTVPESAKYSRLNFDIVTNSLNAPVYEVYCNVGNSDVPVMFCVASDTAITVKPGRTYYVRVHFDDEKQVFNAGDFNSYSLKVVPAYAPNHIEITGLDGDEGYNNQAVYWQGRKFRTKRKLTIYGKVSNMDCSDGSVADAPIVVEYYNPGWDSNKVPEDAFRSKTVKINEDGTFAVTFILPIAIGSYRYDTGASIHYYDLCYIRIKSSENGKQLYGNEFYQLKYSDYYGY